CYSIIEFNFRGSHIDSSNRRRAHHDAKAKIVRANLTETGGCDNPPEPAFAATDYRRSSAYGLERASRSRKHDIVAREFFFRMRNDPISSLAQLGILQTGSLTCCPKDRKMRPEFAER